MSNTDPSWHQQHERQMIEHVVRLLGDPRLVIDTTNGRRPVAAMSPSVARTDRGVDLKRAMTEANKPDRSLQEKMPQSELLDVGLSTKKWFFFKSAAGRLRVICATPMRALLQGNSPTALTAKDVKAAMKDAPLPPPLPGVPTTIVLVSTAGFTLEARDEVDRSADPVVILAEPNAAGGWSIHGPPETKSLNDLLDPEEENQKRQRVRSEIEARRSELLNSGIACDKIASRAQLPLHLVEAEVKSYAKEHAGLQAKRLDGRIVLFREGSAPVLAAATPRAADEGTAMPLFDRIKSLFSRKGETEKKISFLSERRAALSLQREHSYEEISTLEKKDDELRDEFKKARAPLTKKRITSQLLQLRKDIERRQQMVTVLNQQVNVVSTHLHNLELSQQGQTAQLPDSEEIASDAAAAEEMLAQLQADSEVADSVSGIGATVGMSEEEQALFEELEREAAGPTATSESVPEPQLAPEPSRPANAPTREPRKAEPEAG